jgi:2-haloacid dehalogenase
VKDDALKEIKALIFDVFGTIVDWRSSVIREGRKLGQAKGLTIDWTAFADEWRAGYAPAMNQVRQCELPWTRLDELHRMTLDRLLAKYGVANHLDETEKAHLNRVWQRLDPWADSIEGLLVLKQRFILATLSNGNVSLLVNMARYAGLPWDCVLSSELAGHYKRDPQVYQMAMRLLDLKPSQVMMVAAHQDDLQAAHREGMRTAFIKRPLEHGPEATPDVSVDPCFDLVADDLINLARQLP